MRSRLSSLHKSPEYLNNQRDHGLLKPTRTSLNGIKLPEISDFTTGTSNKPECRVYNSDGELVKVIPPEKIRTWEEWRPILSRNRRRENGNGKKDRSFVQDAVSKL